MAIPYTFTNGTIADANEVNANFAVCYPKVVGFVGCATQSSSIGSSTAYVTIATIPYSGGTSPLTSFIKMESYVGVYSATPSNWAQFVISGPGLNNIAMSNANFGGYVGMDVFLDHILTSGALTASGGNVGSNYDLKFQLKTTTGDAMRYGNFSAIGW